MDLAWPLVERQRHLRRIAEVLRRTPAQALVIAAPAGTGKTRLAVEALQQAERSGLPTRWVAATRAAATLPFAAVAHLLGGQAPGGSGLELLAQARAALAQEAGDRRVVLGIDDAHLLDAASAALVGHLAASGTAFLLCTVRSGATTPEPLAALVRSGDAEQLELDPLSEDAVVALVTGALGGQVDGAATHRLWRLSRGNPLLLRELVDDARQRGALAHSGALWRLAAGWAPGERTGDLVRGRLGGLPDDAREVAEALALSEPLEAHLLEEIFAADTLARVDAAGLLEVLPDRRRQRLRLVHPLYSEALRASVAPLRARTLHRRLAGALRATGARRSSDVLRLGAWWLAAGQAGDADTFLAAARQAAAALDNALAERLARAALQAGAGFPAAYALAGALRWQGRAQEVDAVLADWQSQAGTDVELAQAATLGVEVAIVGHGQLELAEELLAKIDALVDEPAARQVIAASRADLALYRWRVSEALGLARPVVEDARAHPAARALAAVVDVAALTLSGAPDRALARSARLLALVRGDRGPEALLLEDQVLDWDCLAHLLAGRPGAAGQLAGERYRAAVHRRAGQAQSWWAQMLGQVALHEGRAAGAERWLREAAALQHTHLAAVGGGILAWTLGLLAEALALQGDAAGAEAALAEADGVFGAEIPVGPRGLGRAWAAAATGEISTARQLALAVAEAARGVGAHAYEGLALHHAVRLGAAGAELRGAADQLAHLALRAEGRLAPLWAAHAAALRDGDPVALEAAGAAFADLGFLLVAAESFTLAAGAQRGRGRAAAAAAAGARARDLAGRCEGARTPALVLDDAPSPLTDREREIAALAAQGLSNRAIAERLVLSVRTVDNHLHRAYGKLGITRRDELPGAR